MIFDNAKEYLEDYWFCECYTYYIVEEEFEGNKELFQKLQNVFKEFVIIEGIFEIDIAYEYTSIYCESYNKVIKQVNKNTLKKCLDLDMDISLVVNGRGSNC